jgi:hypothetical protein
MNVIVPMTYCMTKDLPGNFNKFLEGQKGASWVFAVAPAFIVDASISIKCK